MATSKEIQSLERRLNADSKLQSEFLKDPVTVLKREGITMTADAAKAVKAQFTELQLQKIPKIPELAKPKIGITIKITVKF